MHRKLRNLYRVAYSIIFGTCPGYPVVKRIDTCGVEILANKEFQKSCQDVKRLSVLDTPRLANLWYSLPDDQPRGQHH